jgi:hypothetical protein
LFAGGSFGDLLGCTVYLVCHSLKGDGQEYGLPFGWFTDLKKPQLRQWWSWPVDLLLLAKIRLKKLR